MKVSVMDTRPCLTGSLVWAAAAAIGALPRPASLEKIPRATPFAWPSSWLRGLLLPPLQGRKPRGIRQTRLPVQLILYISMLTHTMTYIMAINGTIMVVTLAILLSPPITTSAVTRAATTAVATVAMEYSLPNRFTILTELGVGKALHGGAIPFT